VAVFALSATITAASASAGTLPALYECAKVAKAEKGKGIWNKGCKVEGKHGAKENEYEVKEGFGKGKVFKGKGGSADLAVKGSVTVSCAKSTDSGKFTGSKAAGDVVAIFSGCEVAGIKCSNTSKAGEIKTNALDGEVGYINAAKKEVGADLKPESAAYLAEFECEESPFPLRLRVSGSVIGRVSPINTFTKSATFTFRESGGKQEVEKFESGLPDTPITGTCKGVGCTPNGEDESGEETTVVNKGEELELKA
jgi:hypothetical protein